MDKAPVTQARQERSVTELLQSVRQLLLQQRKSIMESDTEQLLDISESVRDLLQQAVRCGQAGDDAVRFDAQSGRLVAETEQIQDLLRSIRNHAQLNSELLADAVAFADLTIEALKPDTATYDASGQRDSSGVASLDKSA